jgi:hypothetical protein
VAVNNDEPSKAPPNTPDEENNASGDVPAPMDTSSGSRLYDKNSSGKFLNKIH